MKKKVVIVRLLNPNATFWGETSCKSATTYAVKSPVKLPEEIILDKDTFHTKAGTRESANVHLVIPIN